MTASNDFFYDLRISLSPLCKTQEDYEQMDKVLFELQNRWKGESIYIGKDDVYYNKRKEAIRRDYKNMLLALRKKYEVSECVLRNAIRGTSIKHHRQREGTNDDLFGGK
jgi:Mor family transcriptional regulator